MKVKSFILLELSWESLAEKGEKIKELEHVFHLKLIKHKIIFFSNQTKDSTI